MTERIPHGIVWLRRDLRLDDHAALAAAARACDTVTCAFVLDPALLRGDRMGAPIVQFFFDSLVALRERLRELGSDLALLEGTFAGELGALAQRLGARAVFYSEDVDPAMRARDAAVTAALTDAGCTVHAVHDQTYIAADEILTGGGSFYRVYTPYRRRWDAIIAEAPRAPIPSLRLARARLAPQSLIGPTLDVPRPEAYGHASSQRFPRGGEDAATALLRTFVRSGGLAAYARRRNEPAAGGTSQLSPHLRAGTIGIRTCVDAALSASNAQPNADRGATKWIAELAWRDFYAQLLVHAPRVADEPFVEAARQIVYTDDDRAWTAWATGTTGYPIVDAAMVQLNTTGWMHNRLRMVTASFLTKHLLIDYHRGERYFETHLADADLPANNGGWQWSASTGTDAAPYFRVFNPVLQGTKFDPGGAFVRSMLPVLARVPDAYVHEPWAMPPLIAAEAGCVIGRDYPAPIVDHATARARAIEVYGRILGRTAART
jgi:deoxyribodipyrimidine photo-lyase